MKSLLKLASLLFIAAFLLAACGGEPEEAKFGPYEGGVSMRYEYDALGRLVVYEVDGDVHTNRFSHGYRDSPAEAFRKPKGPERTTFIECRDVPSRQPLCPRAGP